MDIFAFGRDIESLEPIGWTVLSRMTPQRYMCPNLWNLNLLLFCGKRDFADVTVFKDPKIGILSWIFWVGPVYAHESRELYPSGVRFEAGEGLTLPLLEGTTWKAQEGMLAAPADSRQGNGDLSPTSARNHIQPTI